MASYLFDFDGTLVDSMPTFVGAMLNVLDVHGIPHDGDTVKTITPLGYAGAARYFVSLGVPMTVEEILTMVDDFATEAYAHRILAKPNVKETLVALRARGDDLHVLTASPHRMLDPCLKNNGMFELFDNVWSCEDFGTSKADPKIYEMAAARIGRRVEEIIFLDDNLDADRTAKRAGMIVYGVFDESSRAYADDIRAATDRYITDFSELLEE